MSGKKICCICGKEFEEWGNDPYPVKEEGECCDKCNGLYVVPARLHKLAEHERKEIANYRIQGERSK